MNRAQLIDAFRARAFDTRKPYLWSADEVQEYLDDGHREAAERALLLRDSTTADICEVPVTANQALYELDERIIEVLRAKLDLAKATLRLTSQEAMDDEYPACDWAARTGTPSRLVLSQEGRRWVATLNPTPTVADTMRLTVHRWPLKSLSNDKDEPEFQTALHVRLVDWMMHRAYSKTDADTYDPVKAEKHEALFTSAFGPRQSANTRRTQRDLHPHVIQMREY